MVHKFCVATSYDRHFRGIGEYSAMTIRHYAKVHGMSARIMDDFNMDRPPAWHRVWFIPTLFNEGYDFVLWIDADAIFSRFDVDIRKVVEPEKDLYLVQHDLLEWNGPVPNTGVMLIRNSRWSRMLFHDLWQKEEYIEHPWWENAAMLDALGYKGHLGGEHEYNLEMLRRVKFIGHEWNFVPQRDYLADPIITHFAGFKAEERRDLMSRATLQSLFNAVSHRGEPEQR